MAPELTAGEQSPALRQHPVEAPFGEAGYGFLSAPVCVEECGALRCTHPHLPVRQYLSDEHGIFLFGPEEAPLAHHCDKLFRQRELAETTLRQRQADAERRARQATNLDELVVALKNQNLGLRDEQLTQLAGVVTSAVVEGIVRAQTAPEAATPEAASTVHSGEAERGKSKR